MKVFDAHIHVQPWQMVKPEVLAMIDDPSHANAKDVLSSPENFLRHLDAEGIERACCINYVSPDVMGFTRDVNDWIAKFTREHRDRLVPVGSVNPLHEIDVRAEIRRVLDLGIGLIKIHPPHQLFSPNAYRGELWQLAEIYKECEERGVPVMFHTGTSIFPKARNVFADPMPIDDVAIDFPKLQILLAHAGRPLHGETALFLARRHANVHLEISGIPPTHLLSYVPRLAAMADKVLWGTDWPSPGVSSMKRNVEDFRALGLGEAVERKVLWENANALFAR
ncbi:MAG TPA: amidohydrolase family protein [Thermoanaerobaculia bacterium]|jgi:predicted TIM-barrel fold metal-dependent hydrolase|nr:amidohydrolase family protein [Thermoanaerobaculia bacterium]